MSDIAESEIQELPEPMPDSAEQEARNDAEELPDVSPELLALQSDGEPEDTEESPKSSDTVKPPSVNDVKIAEHTAEYALGALINLMQQASGHSYGVDETLVKKTATEVAPCLAKYGLTDTGAVFAKWGAEVRALVALGSLAFGMYAEHKRQSAANQKQAA